MVTCLFLFLGGWVIIKFDLETFKVSLFEIGQSEMFTNSLFTIVSNSSSFLFYMNMHVSSANK